MDPPSCRILRAEGGRAGAPAAGARGQARMREAPIGAHAEPLHHPPGGFVARHGEGDDLGQPQRAEAAPPMRGGDAPADLHRGVKSAPARVCGAGPTAPTKARRPSPPPPRSPSHARRYAPAPARPRHRSRRASSRREMAHAPRIAMDGEERATNPRPPGAQQQAGRFERDGRHGGSWRRRHLGPSRLRGEHGIRRTLPHDAAIRGRARRPGARRGAGGTWRRPTIPALGGARQGADPQGGRNLRLLGVPSPASPPTS